jgi:UDPglucose 6-dehydrogenase
MKITVVGAGYVGLVTAACFAEQGNNVLVFDTKVEAIKKLKAGIIPFHEAGVSDIVLRNMEAGRLQFTHDAVESVYFGKVQFLTVGTPSKENGEADLSYIKAAALNIGRHMPDYRLVVVKSSVPVGTCDKIKAVIAEELKRGKLKTEFSVASNPEFLKEGKALEDFMRPDRVVIGTEDARAVETLKSLYAPFFRNNDRIIVMDTKSAELTKYAANAMLATRISFMNELARFSEKIGADIEMVRKGVGSDQRIGRQFLYAGTGFGGSCFPKDVAALAYQAQHDYGVRLSILERVGAVNIEQKQIMSDKVKARFGKNLSGRKFTLWGLSFKPDTDDMREAPSLAVMAALLQAGAEVHAYDPIVKSVAGFEGVTYHTNAQEALAGSDGLLIMTEWKEFNSPDFEEMKLIMNTPVIFDGRNLYNPQTVIDMGFDYYPIGRQNSEMPMLDSPDLVPDFMPIELIKRKALALANA